jgi:NADH-quinone oxidoreductase subunit I
MTNRYKREAWTKEEAQIQDDQKARGEVAAVEPRAIP